MSDQKPDADKLKREQREVWDANAPGWQKWFNVLEKGAQVVSDRLVALAQLKRGDRVLDIATGTGEPAVTAARAVGESGRVIAIDQSPEMLRFGRERAASLGLNNIEFVEADGESIRMPERSFDAVLCRWGLMFLPNLDAAAAGIRRLMKPRAMLATSVWATPDKVPLIGAGMRAVRQVTGIEPPPPDALGPCRLADTSILRSTLERAGFGEIKIEPLIVALVFASVEVATEYRMELGAVRAMLAKYDDGTRARVRDAMLAGAREYADSSGVVTFRNEAICFSARA